ncbi:aminoacyl-tRNA hydrolase [Candidatus Uhrbacteria bacterium]|nr:aminoacyl-tRNA hydrolase [Candidatus Uhrbacteria bacterium]
MRPLIVGLGNVGKEYEQTRHNVGFEIVDALAKGKNLSWKKEAARHAFVATSREVILAKPTTYMNRSGEAVRELVSFYKPSRIVVIYDDADLPMGEIRVRGDGRSAGHNGIASVIEHIGEEAFTRVRVGIGRPENKDIPLEDWVLGTWNEEEWKKIKNIVEEATQKVEIQP